MKLIVCVDEAMGMMFNNRRQSRDGVLIEHILDLVDDKKIWITAFSESLFKFKTEYILFEEKPIDVGDEDFCFVENIAPSGLEESVDEIILYNWNRSYPSDMKFDICLDNWILVSEVEIKGSSHEKITERIYKKGEKNNESFQEIEQ